MKEERILILKLLEEGKITAVEAEKLLLAIEANNSSISKEMSKKINELGKNVEGWTKDIGYKIDTIYKEVQPKVKRTAQIIVGRTATAIDDITKEIKKSHEKDNTDVEEDEE